jgi:argininosuccinate lyase
MRLFFKDACSILIEKIKHAMETILYIAEENKEIIIPGYTHLQRAQPVFVPHHLFAYLEMFNRDCRRFEEVLAHANSCPLGSGAIAGSTLPIHREIVAKELGFVDEQGNASVTTNSMDAVSDRDLFIEFASVCTTCALHISRISEDIIIWNTTEFGFVRLPDAFTTGSSLMPQKKNPDSLELLRGKCARIQGNLQTLITLVKGLPLTYNRDLQEDKPPVFDCLDQLDISLDVLAGSIKGMTFNKKKCAAAVADPLLLATDLADYLVMEGVAFRDAHHIVGKLVGIAESKEIPLNEISDLDAGAVHSVLSNGKWKEVFNLQRAMNMRDKVGMPGEKPMSIQFKRWKEFLQN